MKKYREMTKGFFDHQSVVLGGMLIVSALFLTAKASAAPAAADKSQTTVRTTTTALDPVALRPAWLSRIKAAKPVVTATASARPTTPAVTTSGPQLGVISMQGVGAQSVQVPVRPGARSPWVPPLQGR